MKKGFHFFITLVVGAFLLSPIIFAGSDQESDIIYKIKYLDKNKCNCFDITVGLKGNREGKIIAKLPNNVEKITFNSKNGKISYKNTDNIYIFSLEPNSAMEGNYHVCVSNQLRNIDFPIIEDGLFHFIAENLLILPDLDPKAIINVQFQFLNFPQNYTIATNHNLNQRDYYVKTSLRNLSRSIIAGGKLDVKTTFIKNRPIHMIVRGKWTFVDNDELRDFLQKMISLQRSFWDDYQFPHFVIMLFDNSTPNGGGGLSASLYENVLSMVFTDTSKKNKPILFGSLSHELFHAWIGNKIRIPEPQGDLQWFFEGLNDFYGWQLALASGEITEHDYIEYYNSLLKEYALSPFKDFSNAEISKYFQLKSPIARLAMVRGHIVFMELLNNLQRENKSRKQLDLALQEIFHNYANNNSLQAVNLSKILKKHVGKQIWTEAEKVLIYGDSISFSQNLFYKNAKLQNRSIEVPNFGFDTKTLVKEQKIRALEPKSKGALAGLKEDAKVIQYQIDMSGRISNTNIIINDSNGQKVINFVPEKIVKTIPRYDTV